MAQYTNRNNYFHAGMACGDREEFKPAGRHRAGEIAQYGMDWDTTWHAGIDRVKTRAIMRLRAEHNND